MERKVRNELYFNFILNKIKIYLGSGCIDPDHLQVGFKYAITMCVCARVYRLV